MLTIRSSSRIISEKWKEKRSVSSILASEDREGGGGEGVRHVQGNYFVLLYTHSIAGQCPCLCRNQKQLHVKFYQHSPPNFHTLYQQYCYFIVWKGHIKRGVHIFFKILAMFIKKTISDHCDATLILTTFYKTISTACMIYNTCI